MQRKDDMNRIAYMVIKSLPFVPAWFYRVCRLGRDQDPHTEQDVYKRQIPPHNLREVIAAVVKIIDNKVEENRETTMEELLSIIKGPDFPTAATILGTRGIEEAYRTGRGKIKVRAVTDIETMPNGKSHIIVTELPYLVNKARLIEKMAELVKTKKIDGITAITDESNREGLRINIELRRDVNANVILNQLLKHTQDVYKRQPLYL